MIKDATVTAISNGAQTHQLKRVDVVLPGDLPFSFKYHGLAQSCYTFTGEEKNLIN